jgi:hypothetical protein
MALIYARILIAQIGLSGRQHYLKAPRSMWEKHMAPLNVL